MDDARERERTSLDACEVASSTECTGLMPALSEDEAEDANRAALYGIHRAARPRRKAPGAMS